MQRPWQAWLLAGLLAVGATGCRQCAVCDNIGGPCGMYSLAGRQLTPVPVGGSVAAGPVNGVPTTPTAGPALGKPNAAAPPSVSVPTAPMGPTHSTSRMLPYRNRR